MNYKLLFKIFGAITALWLLRFVINGESLFRYSFVVWNVFLAMIPVLIEPGFAAIRTRATGWLRKLGQLILAAVWLVFLPNTFYVLTDYMHLNAGVLVNNRDNGNHFATHYMRGDGIYIFDSFLLLVAVVFSAYLGGLALVHAYDYFKRRLPLVYARLSLGVLALLVAVGVYIGRYGRWNSWDGLTQPWRVLHDFARELFNVHTQGRVFEVVLTTLLFQAATFWCVRKLGNNKVEI